MKKLLLNFLMLFCGVLVASAQSPLLSFTTEAEGEISVTIKGSGGIKIDPGDGTLSEEIRLPSGFGGPATPIKITPVGTKQVTIHAVDLVADPISMSTINISDAQLTSIDLSKIPANIAANIIDLTVKSNPKLTSLDVSNLTELWYLTCDDNALTTLDVSKHKGGLTTLSCSNNQLTSLIFDVEPYEYLNKVVCSGNNLKFSTLHPKATSWTTYTYQPQNDVVIAEKANKVDLSSEAVVSSVNTVYSWFLENGTALVEDTDYKVAGGITTFLKEQSSKVYCQMTNTAFGDLTLKTTLTEAEAEAPLGDPVLTFTTESDAAISISTSVLSKGFVKIDAGDGNVYDKELKTSMMGNTFTVTPVGTKEVKFYSDTTKIISLTLSNVQLTSADISGLTELTTLTIRLNPKLTSLDMSNQAKLKYLFVNGNGLTELDLTNNVALENMTVNDNKLTSIILGGDAYPGLWKLVGGNNELSSLDFTKLGALTNVDLSNNKFKFSTLPVKGSAWTNYVYQPQAVVGIAESGSKVDLSSEAVVSSVNTVYSWFLENGTALVEDTDYKVAGGITTFLKEQSSKVYCQMTNTAFGDLTLKTTLTEAEAEAPLGDPVLTFTTESDAAISISTSVLSKGFVKIDAGDGNVYDKELKTSMMGNTFTVTPVGTKEVKFYSDTTKIISLTLSNVQLTSADISGLTELTTLTIRLNPKLTSLDMSNQAKLKYLFVNGNGLTELDLTNNVALENMTVNDNKLTSIILGGDAYPGLWKLVGGNNELSSLDFTKLGALTNVDLSNNKFKFSTLPVKGSAWTNYVYQPQAVVGIAESGSKVDLSSEAVVSDVNTVYSWFLKDGTALTADTDYKVAGGITTFLTAQTDSVYCQMTNTAFGDLTLKTTLTEAEAEAPLGDPIFAFTTESDAAVSIITSVLSSGFVKIDAGDGNVYEKELKASFQGNTFTVTPVGTKEVKFYSDTTKIISLTMDNAQLTSVDISGLTELTTLMLRSNPKLTSLDVSNQAKLKMFMVNGNGLTELDLTNNVALENITVNDNKLTSITLGGDAYPGLWKVACGNNELSSFDFSKLSATAPANVDLSNNKFKFSTLPLSKESWVNYAYAPQAEVEIATEVSKAIDLSSEATIDGQATTYKWITKGGVTLTEGTDYSVENGVTSFYTTQTDSVYCEMTNTTFPLLSGADVLKTTMTYISETDGIFETGQSGVVVYAINNNICVDVESSSSVEVYDASGVLVKRAELAEGHNEISAPKGLFIVKVTSNNTAASYKVLVK
ncbi:hypothetical protein M2132_001677 [Dysgonomonas sp. PH5-45]|uniref:T9SS type A sorting domain-containing protein n=1 Tax=unclassified Dysgonomonas TaxID=2630389 RepID=UPI002475FEB7|nr:MULTISPECIES: T9SS type A sorting domain-containing protein [unclassified Dysgonomonas]MDH6355336.1 hypothetical protein [Dysgonomonas sp. PH5-45]MDH6388234.1 hypothetical protein [Dysgonomonas sp. PH5-37]